MRPPKDYNMNEEELVNLIDNKLFYVIEHVQNSPDITVAYILDMIKQLQEEVWFIRDDILLGKLK